MRLKMRQVLSNPRHPSRQIHREPRTMKRFAALYTALDASTSTHDKLEALTTYFAAAAPEDAAWASYFLAGGKPRQSVPTRLLREIACERAGLPAWLFEESYQAVGDLAETIAHILPPAQRISELGLTQWIEQRVLTLRGVTPDELRTRLVGYWDELDWGGRFLLTKLIGGGFRVGVARQLVVRALAEVAGVDHKRIAQRMVGWTDSQQKPDAARYLRLIAPESASAVNGETGNGAQQGVLDACHTRSFSRIRCRPNRRRWATRIIGTSNGSGTASVPNWSNAPAVCGCGRAAKT
jgi:DNA ligase-1